MRKIQEAPNEQRLKDLFRREKSLFVWACVWAVLSAGAWIAGWTVQLFAGSSISSYRRIIWFPSWLGPLAEWVAIFAAALVITLLEWFEALRRRKKEQRSRPPAE